MSSHQQYVSCADIKYSQDSISMYFQNGSSINDPIRGKPVIDVFLDKQGRYWTLNNRTLYQVEVVWGRKRILCNVYTDSETRTQAMRKRRGFNGRGMHNGSYPSLRNTDSSNGSSEDEESSSSGSDGSAGYAMW